MNVLDEYDKGEPERDDRRLTVRWKADGRNVMTDDGPEEKALHIATYASPAVAQHVVDLHHRTLGDGQDPPAGSMNAPVGQWAEQTVERRVREYLETVPPAIQIEIPGEPVMMANILVKLGWKVEPPEEST